MATLCFVPHRRQRRSADAGRPVGLIGLTEPIQPKAMITPPDNCYAIMVIQPGRGRVNCLPSPLPFEPELKSRGRRKSFQRRQTGNAEIIK